MTDHFGEIRSLVHAQPSAERWVALCQLLLSWPEEDLQQRVLPYVDNHLEQWPSHLKITPKGWIARLNQGVNISALSIVKHIHATGHQPTGLLLAQLAELDAITDIESLTLRENLAPEDFEYFHNWPTLPHLNQLTLQNHQMNTQTIDRLIETFGASRRLQHLDLSHNRMAPSALNALVSNLQHWPTLHSLQLQGNQADEQTGQLLANHIPHANFHALSIGQNMGTQGMRALLATPWLKTVQTLDISHNQIDHRLQDELVVFLRTSQLRELNLSHNTLDPALFQAIMPHLSTIVSLDLGDTQLGNMGAMAFETCHLPNLQHLSLYRSHLTEAGIRSLLEQQNIDQLCSLDLALNHLEPQSMAHWDESVLLQLKHLNVGNNHLADDGAYYLSRTHNLEQLLTLKLYNNQVTARGCRALATSPSLIHLQHLDLSSNPIGSAGAHALTEHDGLQNLHMLNLTQCELDDDAAYAIAHCEHLKNLQTLKLSKNNITPSGYAHLAQSPYLPLHLRVMARQYSNQL